MTLPDHHLDLGCGRFPRNPYARGRLSGIDIRAMAEAADFDYRLANLALQPIPHANDAFGSVSAYDFIEHVPRILMTPDGRDTRFPFVQLMQEVWRVLAPGGLFYALTPAFPNPEAFTDPTHVNIITDRTHEYFCGQTPMARIYGFQGAFKAVRADWVHLVDAYSAIPGSAENRNPAHVIKRIAHGARSVSRWLRGHQADRKTYFLWELQAVKAQAPAS